MIDIMLTVPSPPADELLDGRLMGATERSDDHVNAASQLHLGGLHFQPIPLVCFNITCVASQGKPIPVLFHHWFSDLSFHGYPHHILFRCFGAHDWGWPRALCRIHNYWYWIPSFPHKAGLFSPQRNKDSFPESKRTTMSVVALLWPLAIGFDFNFSISVPAEVELSYTLFWTLSPDCET